MKDYNDNIHRPNPHNLYNNISLLCPPKMKGNSENLSTNNNPNLTGKNIKVSNRHDKMKDIHIHKLPDVENISSDMNPKSSKMFSLKNINHNKEENEIHLKDKYSFEKREDDMYNMSYFMRPSNVLHNIQNCGIHKKKKKKKKNHQIKHRSFHNIYKQINIINDQIDLINNKINKNSKDQNRAHILEISPLSLPSYIEYKNKNNNIFSSYFAHPNNKTHNFKKIKMIKKNISNPFNKEEPCGEKKNSPQVNDSKSFRYFDHSTCNNNYHNKEYMKKEQKSHLHSNHNINHEKGSDPSYNLNTKNTKNVTNTNDQTCIYEDHTFEKAVENNKVITSNHKII
ncbi:hypothetical protein PFMG_04868 [Plasmodium falciparum IGH-CR14]|uniref:Uncharacterized protein n=1 Tax=Plasmodium falciparum IGH-CR14 TaxID=580059 RepID=A0A0L1IHW3_PLAFA|nr:hypothetical protein PFMG_04868 [Plasmodium falciparum IGH-CR14]